MNHLPMRGDGVECWLQEHRDVYRPGSQAETAIARLLREYQRKADAQEVMEGTE